MQNTMKIKVMEKCEISPSPPPHSHSHSHSHSLPLTFLDIPWLFFPPSQPLFFYEYPHSLNHFTSTTLPILKNSLSPTLHHFYPFASKLTLLHQNNNKPIILSSHKHDHVSLTVAFAQPQQVKEEDGQNAGGLILAGHFFHLSSNYQREATQFHSLVPPPLEASEEMEMQTMVPLMSIQITLFPCSGICIGLSYHHVASDARTFNNFIKTWALYSNSYAVAVTTTMNINKYLPTHDRALIKDSHGLEDSFLYEWSNTRKAAGETRKLIFGPTKKNDSSNMVRVTFVVGSADIERIKRWIVSYCMGNNISIPIHLSPYVVACAFLWVCWVKTHAFTAATTTATNTTTQVHQAPLSDSDHDHDHTPVYFGFVAGGLTRLEYRVPASYFGNCVGFGRVRATKSELMGKDGIIVAANGIGNMVRKLDRTLFDNAKTWISDWKVLSESELNLVVIGSPKVDLYDTDFGWGRPRKIEDVSIDRTRNVSLHESRDVKGGIEVGLALNKATMDLFDSVYTHGLKALSMSMSE